MDKQEEVCYDGSDHTEKSQNAFDRDRTSLIHRKYGQSSERCGYQRQNGSLRPSKIRMSKQEVKIVNLEGINYIVVDNEAFDWSIEPDQVKHIQFQINNDPTMKDTYVGNILTHFTSCFSEFLGRKVSLKDINEALERGYI